jgi:RNA polymerase sigma-70 factor (ECF subfamily)
MAEPTLSGQADGALLDAWRKGDRIAGDVLVERHFPVLFRFFRSKGIEDVDDLAQQTFLTCLEQTERTFTVSFRAYLLGVARHLLFRRYRARERQDRALSRAVSAEQLVQSPSSALRARDELELLAAALRRIPIDLQIVVELYYWESMRVNEIAEVVEIPSGTVQSRLARARDVLRREIEQLPADAALRRTTLEGFERWARALRDRMSKASNS